ncbi:type II toxin-antitoxin system HicA family toxin [Geomonas oryzae]|jgi:YcfA-like protein.|uniref:type II toxin-antitoxin system HicA family toxin n=1 Tax=Geomonas oryzae TaxID=2364273 RepID=UPI00100B5BD7|nr:type II toxin-antitoxin system HicA family toxin [Geomonas oryzae]
MGTAEKQLERMRHNPRDWRIETLVAVATRYGVEIRNHGGSHHVFSFPGIELAVTIPAHRPIKPIYVRQLVALIDQARSRR